MSEKSHSMRPYNGKVKTVRNPLGRKLGIRPRGSKKCIEGVCMDVVKTENQKHFFLKDEGGNIHQFGEGAMVVSMSRFNA